QLQSLERSRFLEALPDLVQHRHRATGPIDPAAPFFREGEILHVALRGLTARTCLLFCGHEVSRLHRHSSSFLLEAATTPAPIVTRARGQREVAAHQRRAPAEPLGSLPASCRRRFKSFPPPSSAIHPWHRAARPSCPCAPR